MMHSLSRSIISHLVVLTLGTGVISIALVAPFSAHASVVNWERGASIWPNSSTDYASDQFKQSLQNLKNDGANYVNLIIPIYQSTIYSTDIAAGYNTPTDASLIQGIQYAHSIGLKVMLSLYLNPYDNQWRAYIDPPDRDTWFQKYGDELVHYAKLGQSQGVEQMCLGAEMTDVDSPDVHADNTQRWDTMIANVRAVFSGKLVYDANRDLNSNNDTWNAASAIQFWDKLDYIGISAYYPLAGDGSVANLMSQWQVPAQQDVEPLSKKWGKPVLFAEVGYRSVSGAHNQPWDSWTQGSYDAQEQVNDYQALFQFWNNESEMQGAFLWWWSPNPNYGGSGDTDFTPQNKPAEQILKQYWLSSNPPPSPSAPLFSVNGSASPAAATAGQTITLSASVKDTGTAVSNAIIDMEVYQGNTRVYQKIMSGQNFSSGATQQYSGSWTPSAAGTYTFKLGVFTADWSKNYDWNDSVATVTVQAAAPAPTPGSYPTDIWWPTNGGKVSGVQPFKAMLEGLSTAQYSMYWQVDGGQLNQMANSTQDYPHKESLVDLSGWKWKGSGPYTITFVSKDNNGNVLSQKPIEIYTP